MLQKIILFLFVIGNAYSQTSAIKIEDETKNNRLSIYALNKTETDYDVKINITGKNIRQSTRKPRFVRVPAASKVLLKSLIIERGKQPSYTYELEVNDSLSHRSLKPPSESIKIDPPKQIVVYVTENCMTCDSILSRLANSKYIFTTINLVDKPDVKERMMTYLGDEVSSLESLTNPILNIGGLLYTKIENYEMLLESLNKPD